MAKRFTDTDKWKRQSFRELPHKAKLAFLYLCDQCDYCGIWPSDFPQMSFHLGFPVKESDLVEWFGDKIVKFDSDKFFLATFFEFQYGDAKDGFRAKTSAINRLQKLGLMNSNLEVARVSPECPPSVPDTPSIVLCSVVESFEEGVGETLESQPKPFGPRELAAAWNGRMASVKSMNGQRHIPLVDLESFDSTQERWISAKERLEKKPSREYWVDVIDRIARSEFCRGKNDRNWLANLDFLVRKKTHIAVMEGQYGCTPKRLAIAPAQSAAQPEPEAPVSREAKLSELASIEEQLKNPNVFARPLLESRRKALNQELGTGETA